MMNRRQRGEAAQRFEDRRTREDTARRLRDELPTLRSLRLELDEYRQEGTVPLVSHVRLVVVDRAPALFVFQCHQSDCDGDHDITRQLMPKLARGVEEFAGEHECYGSRNGNTCRYQLRYRVVASYDA